MSVGVKLEAERVLSELKALGQGFDQMPLLGVIGQRLLRWVMQNFRAACTEKKWVPLSPNTIAGRRAGRIKKSQGAVRFRGRNVVGAAVSLSGAKPLQDTGRLRQSFVSKVRNLGTPYVEVGTENQIASFHEHGTKPYVIQPKRARRLIFMTAGGVVFARKVNHPGLPQRKMLPSENLMVLLGMETMTKYLRQKIRDSRISDGAA